MIMAVDGARYPLRSSFSYFACIPLCFSYEYLRPKGAVPAIEYIVGVAVLVDVMDNVFVLSLKQNI